MATTRVLISVCALAGLALAVWHLRAESNVGLSMPEDLPAVANVRATQAHRASSRRVPPTSAPQLNRWERRTTSNESAELDLEELADLEEREAMLAEDRLPEQRAWRSTWLSEEEDEEWTLAMAEEMRRDIATVVTGHVNVRRISCRETVCRLYLDLSDLEDAEAFMAVERDPNLHYEFQLMNPGADDDVESAEDAAPKHHIEVLVAREDAVAEPT